MPTLSLKMMSARGYHVHDLSSEVRPLAVRQLRGVVLVPATATGPLNAKAEATSATPIRIFMIASSTPSRINCQPPTILTSTKPA